MWSLPRRGTSGQWHCFRKKYDPALPEEVYMIYTDSVSFFQMQQSWTRTNQVLGAASALALIYLLRSPTLSAALRLASVLSLEAGAWLRVRAMWQTQPHAAQLRRSALGVYGAFGLGAILLLVNIIL